jgi:LytR cell envelope-related transcriptional attenuator
MSLARVRALIVIGVLALIALSTVVWAIVKDGQTKPHSETVACEGEVKVQTAIPPAASVKLRVFNATDVTGLAGTAKTQLMQAGFRNITTGNATEAVDATAQVRYGPAGVGAAYLVRAHVKNSTAEPDDSRKDATVDLILGNDYTTVNITPANEVKAELERLGAVEYDGDAGC